MNLDKKHKLLSIFCNHYTKQENNGATKDISKSLCVDELIYHNKWSNENLDELHLLIEQLLTLNFIEPARQNGECTREYVKYFATSDGKLAYYNKYFINQLLRKDKRFLIPVIISSLAFLTSVGTLWYNISNNSKTEQLQGQVKKLKKDKLLLVKRIEQITKQP